MLRNSYICKVRYYFQVELYSPGNYFLFLSLMIRSGSEHRAGQVELEKMAGIFCLQYSVFIWLLFFSFSIKCHTLILTYFLYSFPLSLSLFQVYSCHHFFFFNIDFIFLSTFRFTAKLSDSADSHVSPKPTRAWPPSLSASYTRAVHF